MLAITDERTLLYITASAVDNVSCLHSVLCQSLGISLSNAGDSVFDDSIVCNVLWHYRRNSIGHIVGGMQLTPKGASLDVPATPPTRFSQR